MLAALTGTATAQGQKSCIEQSLEKQGSQACKHSVGYRPLQNLQSRMRSPGTRLGCFAGKESGSDTQEVGSNSGMRSQGSRVGRLLTTVTSLGALRKSKVMADGTCS